ncbi:MAG: thymidine phosphorylase [Leptolyngbya sp.]|nr:thymidine phosphorylase [Candidatus Melainabacteria bacterium]
MRMVDVILAKRNGKEHSKEEIDFVIEGLMSGKVPDYQIASWLMAVCWKGMTLEETACLTEGMCNSGEVLDLKDVGDIVADKHSTGGVGDKTTLVFVPLMAAAGVPMAKLSGRGLGHTGGTIDKLEAIPGFKTDIPISQFIKQVKEIGMAIAGQTQELAPADGKMYALRDVTGTVESIPLIAASIVSKKAAAGTNLIILDVKCGRGAFMETEEKAHELAKTMVEVGKRINRPITAVVTNMEQPLGMAVGHTLEVIEAIETLKGTGPGDLHELTLALGSLALVKAGKAKDEKAARMRLVQLMESGSALEHFRKLIVAQGGNPEIIEKPELMPTAKHEFDLLLPGQDQRWVKHIDGRKVAEACKILGAGRAKKGDPINLAVGVVLACKVGSVVRGGQSLAVVHADSEGEYDAALPILTEAFTFSEHPVAMDEIVKYSVS